MLRGRRGAAAALLAAALAGCGLEDIVTLSPPDPLPAETLDEQYRFTLDGDNNEPEFRGVELYYRLYNTGAGGAPVGAGLLDQDQLGPRGFRRLTKEGDTEVAGARPLIFVPVGPAAPDDIRGGKTTVVLSLDTDTTAGAPANDTRITATRTDATGGLDTDVFGSYPELAPLLQPIRRGVAVTPGGVFRTFDDFWVGDADVSAFAPTAESYDDIEMEVYALSYGKVDIATTVYSAPQYLGILEIPSLTVSSP